MAGFKYLALEMSFIELVKVSNLELKERLHTGQ